MFWNLKIEKETCICYSSHLGWCTNVLTEEFLQGFFPLRYSLTEETMFMSEQSSAIKEVNDWVHNICVKYHNYMVRFYIS